jgi:fructose-1,6-bisphosphatase/inositol monophosphatase family enzyme
MKGEIMKHDRYGPLTEPAIGILLKEMVRRAVEEIRKLRFAFEVTHKVGYDGGEDLFTTADTQAQAIYAKLIPECFPGYGIIAEEAGLRVPCRLRGMNAYFTIDPLDGTKAFKRGQAFGVATQIALVINGEVVAVYVGDVNTYDGFGYRPGSPKVHHISNLTTAKDLTQVPRGADPRQLHMLLRVLPEEHHPLLARLVKPVKLGGMFKGCDVVSGSVGLSMSRLWRGEVGAHVLPRHFATPWDTTPLIGMAKKLNLVWLRPNRKGYGLEVFEPQPPTEVVEWNFDMIVIHANAVRALMAAAEA